MVRQRRLYILIMIPILMIAVTHASLIDAGDNHISTIPYDQFIVEGISIGSTYDDIVKSLGKPVKVKKEIITGGPGLLVYFKGMEIVISEDEAVNITITGVGYKMKNGITIGSSKKEVFDKLGKARVSIHMGRNTVRYTVLTPQGEYADAELILYFKDNKVDEIVFFFAYV
jgi:hypothetical protein